MRKYEYLFGSKMLKLENNRDEDLVVYVDETTAVARKYGYHSISFSKNIIDRFVGGKDIKPDIYKALFLYQNSCGFDRDADYPFSNFNILEHKEVWKKWLKTYINSRNVEAKATETDILPKMFYHLLYQYYMITENTHWISDEAKADVQKIHDLEVPASYFYELRNLINNL